MDEIANREDFPSDDAYEAYLAAWAEIERAMAAGETTLNLSGRVGRPELNNHLDRLPENITQFTQVTVLSLDNTQVSDLEPIRNLSALTLLSLQNTQVSDLEPIRNLSALTELWLSNTQVSDLAPIQNLTALTVLSLDNTQVSDLEPIRNLSALTTLWLSNTQVSDLEPIRNLTALTGLWLHDTQVSDLEPIRNLSALTGLWLQNTQVSDLAPIRNLSMLTELWLNDTQVSDLAPIRNLSALTTLLLSNTQVSDLTLILELEKLGYVHFQSCAATKADPRLDTISKIKEGAERLEPLRAYLLEEKKLKETVSNLIEDAIAEIVVDMELDHISVRPRNDQEHPEQNRGYQDMVGELLDYAEQFSNPNDNSLDKHFAENMRRIVIELEKETPNFRIIRSRSQAVSHVLKDKEMLGALGVLQIANLRAYNRIARKLLDNYYPSSKPKHPAPPTSEAEIQHISVNFNLPINKMMSANLDIFLEDFRALQMRFTGQFEWISQQIFSHGFEAVKEDAAEIVKTVKSFWMRARVEITKTRDDLVKIKDALHADPVGKTAEILTGLSALIIVLSAFFPG